MKIILSRKGFDSANGGKASPILPNGRLISLPIPDKRNNTNCYKYSELKINCSELNGLEHEITTYYDFMKELEIDKIKISKDNEKPLDEKTKCHLDPDIRKEILDDERLGAFGQSKRAAKHLRDKKVGKDDLFLFFGRFQQTRKEEGKLKFVKGAPCLHIIFGYLQVGECFLVKNATGEQKKRYQRHPHLNFDKEEKYNTIYGARETLNLDDLTSFPGYSVLNCSDDRVLTNTKLEEYTCSKWSLPFHGKKIKISYHTKKNPWKEEGYFQSTAPGQEFVIEADDEEAENCMREWAKKIISGV